MSAFLELGLLDKLVQGIDAMGWTLPTPPQQEAIPLILGGGDVLCAAETGTGKTGAFSLPMLQICFEQLLQDGKKPLRAGPVSHASVCFGQDDRDPALAVSPDGLLVQSRAMGKGSDWQGARASRSISHGRYYYEAEVTDEGLCRVGWSTALAKFDLGTDRFGCGYGGTGKASFNRQFDAYGEPFGKGDIIGCYIDLDSHTVHYAKNGKQFPVALRIPKHLHRMGFFPAVVLKNAEMRFNFGATPLRFPPPDFFPVEQARPEDLTQASDQPSGKRIMGLVLEPSRDLAFQTFEQLNLFKKFLPQPGLSTALVVGGVDAKEQIRALKDGVDIVVGTPGRLADFLETGKMDLGGMRFFILDEADRLLDTGNREEILKMFQRAPKGGGRGTARLQVLLFSATLHSPEIKQLAETVCEHPTWADLKGADSVPDTVHHVCVRINPRTDARRGNPRPRITTDGVHRMDNVQGDTPAALSEKIKLLKAVEFLRVVERFNMDQCMVFMRTKVDADNLEQFLHQLDGGGAVSKWSCSCLHGDRSVSERRSNLQGFKDGEFRFLICTDVAARGIDINELPYLINYTLPDNAEDYIHRVGRVGRADRMGLAISLVATESEKVWFHSCKSKGKGCSNTRLKEDGGCCIWYDEPELLRLVSERLDMPVPEMDEAGAHSGAGVVYGAKIEKKSGPPIAVAPMHDEATREGVKELAVMEREVQLSYLMMRKRG